MILTKNKKQKGQSLLYVSILAIVIISGVFFVYDIGNMVNTKIKFQNGADSAALSAVAAKITKHHTESMVRTAMYNESIAAQAQQRAAQAVLIKILLKSLGTKPGGDLGTTPIFTGQPVTTPGGQPPALMPDPTLHADVDDYRDLANLTYKHVTKLHRERKALEGYYTWLSPQSGGAASIAVTETAKIGLRGNTFGLMSAKTPGLAENLKILSDPTDLPENKREFANIGGVPYSNEGGTFVGNFGKTYIEFEGRGLLTNQGTNLLKYFDNFNQYTMTTNAAARIASSEELKTPKSPVGIVSPYLMLWYSPRLMSIEKKTDITIH